MRLASSNDMIRPRIAVGDSDRARMGWLFCQETRRDTYLMILYGKEDKAVWIFA